MGEVLAQAQPRNTLFTGSQRVAELLAVQLAGKVGRGLGAGGCLGVAYAPAPARACTRVLVHSLPRACLGCLASQPSWQPQPPPPMLLPSNLPACLPASGLP